MTNKIVLVVDDDPSMLSSVRRLLRSSGYDSLLFSSAEAFENHHDFDNVVCILLDINLDGSSGIELRRRLTATNISVPVIYMTANDTPAVREEATGSVAYLTKPFAANTLIEAINRAAACSSES